MDGSVLNGRNGMEAIEEAVRNIKRSNGIIGREQELRKALLCALAGRHLLIEGPVGVGKTVLATSIANYLGRPIFRVDGDERYTENKLTGWFDPPLVMQKGYGRDSFLNGPLASAMEMGGILFINELNRLNEGVQNVLLPAMDEGRIELPRLGTLQAGEGFMIIATQNPREFVATSSLSEALSDRFELLPLGYQSETEEMEIVRARAPLADDYTIEKVTLIVRESREHPAIKRGASIRAATSMASLLARTSTSFENFREVAYMCLPTRFELREDSKKSVYEVIDELLERVFAQSTEVESQPQRVSQEEQDVQGHEKKTISK
ncbi:MAG: MoxR family ATPase [Methanomassiliicoccales archaeon]